MRLENFVQFWRNRQPHLVAEGILKRWGALGVAIFAVIYYAQYYRSGLNLGGEGGTVAVIAMRLMTGERPIVDTFLGYNVMWFYPVAWLFELTGPNYIALRIFFFALCTITGVMAFYVVRRVTGSGWFATLVALGPVLIPGMMFRNYMGFLTVLNMLTLLQAYVFEQRTVRRQRLWMAGAGAALGLTYLVRIDIGAFFMLITLGLIVLYPWGKRGGFSLRLRQAVWGLVLTVGMFLALHAPFYLDAVKRGYDKDFVAQYTGWINLVCYLAAQELVEKPQSSPPAKNIASPKSVEVKKPENSRDVDSEDYLQKQALADSLNKGSFYERAFVMITYLPIPAAMLIVIPAGLVLLVALARKDFFLREEALALLITTGSALTLFPQYFFFRPDTPHLSEFMVPFQIAAACAIWVAFRWARRMRLAAVWGGLVLIFCVADVGLYFYHSFPKESAGTIAARRKRKSELVAENGVRVRLKTSEREELQQLCDLVSQHTKPGDYLVCYPYAPTVNFMTNRPSFEYNLYVDNAFNVATFHEDTLREFAKYHPAVVVIDNRDINKTEESRFKNWAAQTYRWIRKNYAYAGTFRRQELYFRPDLYAPSAP
jgi:hypothetical protein